MSAEIIINSQTLLDGFIERVYGLHDALVHEAILMHPGYVDERGWMYGDAELPNARLIIQCQSSDVIGIELSLFQVSTFNLRYDSEMRLDGEVLKDRIVLYPHGKSSAAYSLIQAKEIHYRMLGMESRGPQFRLLGIAREEIMGPVAQS